VLNSTQHSSEINAKKAAIVGEKEVAQKGMCHLRHQHHHNSLTIYFHVVEQGAFDVAQTALSVAEKVVDGAGYKLAHEAVNVAQDALDAAKKAGEAAMDVANKALAVTKDAQGALITAAQKELDDAKKECDQSKAWNAAKDVLTAYMNTEATLLEATAKAVTELASCAEKLAYDAAVAAVTIARSATKEIDLAKSAVSTVEGATNEMAALGSWMVKNVGNIFNVRKIELSGSLKGATAKPPVPLSAKIDAVFADKEVDFSVEFTPGKAEDFLKSIFDKIMGDVKADVGSFVKHL